MAENSGIYKTQVSCQVGLSIANIDPTTGQQNAWQKFSTTITSESGPGYPTENQLAYLTTLQMNDAVAAINRQLNDATQDVLAELKKNQSND